MENIPINLEIIYGYFISVSSTVLRSWTFWIIFIWITWASIFYTLIGDILYICAFVYERICLIKTRGSMDEKIVDRSRDLAVNLILCAAKIANGYEVIGLENVPNSGGALFVCYHGAWPSDMFFLFSELRRQKSTKVKLYVASFVFKMPGKHIARLMNCFSGNRQELVQTLLDGYAVILAPGGIWESQLGDSNYELIWKQRTGFARAALEAKVPIIPVFTQNIRELFIALGTAKGWLRQAYLKNKIPFVPVIGGFPVKLRTFLGEPIPYDPEMTPEELAEKTAEGIRTLIKEHQRIPGSIVMALLDRFHSISKKKSD